MTFTPIPHGPQARSAIFGYVRTGVLAANIHGDAINGIPYGKTTLALVLGREPTALELRFAQDETAEMVRALARQAPPSPEPRRLVVAGA